MSQANVQSLMAVQKTAASLTFEGEVNAATEYTEGATDSSITGIAILWEDTSDTLRAVSASKPLPVGDGGGSLTVDNGGTFAVQVSSALPGGTNAIGKLAANSGVDIGDVDVTSVVPGTGATSLGKAEDNAHSSGDTGVLMLAVRRDSASSGTDADGDYATLSVDSSGNLRTVISGAGDASSAKQDEQTDVLSSILSDTNTITGAVATNDDAFGATDGGMVSMFVRDDAPSDLAIADGDYGPARMNQRGSQWVAFDTTLDATNDAIAIGSKAGQGFLVARNIDVDETEDAVKASAGTLLGYYFANLHPTDKRYLRFYNATTANVTVGTTPPVVTFPLFPATAGHIWLGEGIAFDTAITVAATTGIADNDTGAPGANEVVVNSFYR